jgi:hypothetical protein
VAYVSFVIEEQLSNRRSKDKLAYNIRRAIWSTTGSDVCIKIERHNIKTNYENKLEILHLGLWN